jgi:4-hydroxy-tetrahydrodipicolinate reductase
MGQTIIELADDFKDITISYKHSTSSSNNDLNRLFESSDVVVDFTSPAALSSLLSKALHFNKKLLIGTTGFSAEQYDQIHQAAKKIAIFCSPNTSVCVNLMSQVLKLAASKLPASDYDVDIIDIHHKQKKDAPSGTALMFAKSIDEGRGHENSSRIFNRHAAGQRAEGDIDFCSIRSGNQPAQLEVIFSGMHESISFTHQAYSRSVFASQALRIAVWLYSMPVGFYTMNDYTVN